MILLKVQTLPTLLIGPIELALESLLPLANQFLLKQFREFLQLLDDLQRFLELLVIPDRLPAIDSLMTGKLLILPISLLLM